jgi:hypothetical protein
VLSSRVVCSACHSGPRVKALGINLSRAIAQIAEYNNDLGNGYTQTLDSMT